MRQRTDMPFTIAEYQERLDKVRKRMVEAGLDALIVHTQQNINYLTGFSTTGYWTYQALIVPLDREPVMVVRNFEATNVEGSSWLEDYRPVQDYEDAIQITRETLAKLGLLDKRIGLDKSAFFIPLKQWEQLLAALPEAKLSDGFGCIEQVRIIKSPKEIDYVRQAAKIVSLGMRAGVDAVAEGKTENEVTIEAYRALVGNGSEYIANPLFVASGPRSACGHATWAGRRVEKGDVFYFELAACRHRYHAPLMRSCVVGQPSEIVSRAARACLAALDSVLKTIKPGVTSGEADAAARRCFAAEGVERYFRHRTGYSVGVGYPPGWTEGHIFDLKKGDPRVIQANMIFHLPLLLLVDGVGGIGFSETLVTTEQGVEVLTNMPRELEVR